jgi:hypothetical protein
MSGHEVVGLVFLVIGLVLFAGAAALFARGRAAAGWASAAGRITTSRLEQDVSIQQGGRSRTYRVRLAYEYEVDGRRFTGSRREFGESLFGWMSSRDRARALLDLFPEGRDVTVHYDPAHPERCTLSREVDASRFGQLLVAAAIIAAAGAGVLAGLVKVA